MCIPLDDRAIYNHLAGIKDHVGKLLEATIGIYPLLKNETCWFLAIDFDEKNWLQDISAFLVACQEKQVPAYVERSRSGNGGHVWIFFTAPVLAATARKMGAFLVTETMDKYPEIGFESYDRFFPNQDKMPSGGFGNLIALPLQKIPREKSNSVFLDPSLQPYQDQWAFLVSLQKMTPEQVELLAQEGTSKGRVIGLRLPVENESEDPWTTPPSRVRSEQKIQESLPKTHPVVLGNLIYILKDGLPPQLINRLIRIAAFQNPEFYKAQALRFSTFAIPRIIACAENFPKHIGLPRGCLLETLETLQQLGIEPQLQDERFSGTPIKTKFLGKLLPAQKEASKALLAEETGVLAATTAFGKTVVAAYIIAKRKCNTLILVHRKQLLDQWLARLETFLDTSNIKIGQIGSGKRKPSGMIDVALIQSLVKKGKVDDLVANYGQVIVDECHHLSAFSFEAVVKECKAKYFLGLTATAIRKDGHHPIIFMQCGPIRYKVDPRAQALARPFRHEVIQKQTAFQLPPPAVAEEKISINVIYSALAANKERNELIFADVMKCLEAKRSPLLLTERREHLLYLANQFRPFAKHVIVLHGGMSTSERKEALELLAMIPEEEERLLLSTGRYLGEGFDDARLDTLFLSMPISWKGTLAQYAGRLHRSHHAKKEVLIYDYVDQAIPMLAKMSEKRLLGYKSLGYEVRGKCQEQINNC